MPSLRTYAAWGITGLGIAFLPGMCAISWEGFWAAYECREMKPWVPVFMAGQRAGMLHAQGAAAEIWRLGKMSIWFTVPFAAFILATLVYYGRDRISTALWQWVEAARAAQAKAADEYARERAAAERRGGLRSHEGGGHW